jgi:hypothetical protein
MEARKQRENAWALDFPILRDGPPTVRKVFPLSYYSLKIPHRLTQR